MFWSNRQLCHKIVSENNGANRCIDLSEHLFNTNFNVFSQIN